MQRFAKLFSVSLVVIIAWAAGPAWAEVWTLVPAQPDLVDGTPPTVDAGLAHEGEPQGPSRLGHHQVAKLNPLALEDILDRAPLEATLAADWVEFQLPTPQGTLETFIIAESSVMEPGLQQWFDDQGWPMRTYAGISLDRPGVSVRLDWGGPKGFHAIVRSKTETYFVDPAGQDDLSLHVAYDKRENVPTEPLRCGGAVVGPDNVLKSVPSMITDALPTPQAGASTNGNLRRYRLAYAVTGDYTVNLANGSVVEAQANVVTIINRVNATYERELSVRFVLVGNNASLVYDDPDTDPYTQSETNTMLTENQANIDAEIGPANYDIGHVMYNGGSGVAQLAVPCRSGKARGVSGVFQATGDSIVVDMIAHEMGHQFGAAHTFNSPLGFCTNQRSGTQAWEPGSGTTIMGYSGICNADNVQNFADDYFHAGSLDIMLDYIAGLGSCATTIATGNNNAPTVSATGGFTLPVQTPFELAIDSASDGDGDTLTFTWEQFDIGAAAELTEGDNGDNPLFRSLPPSTRSTRVITGERFGETLPTTTRDLTFRVTARDNNPAGGRVGEANIALSTTANAGPFVITSPNGGESLLSSQLLNVQWDVAGTTGAGVNASTVDIMLSTDGGETFPTMLASGVSNDGVQDVALPAVVSDKARIKIRPTNNIFFAQSAGDFQLNSFEQCIEPDAAIPNDGSTAVTADIVVTGQTDQVSGLAVELAATHVIPGLLTATIEHVDTAKTVQLFDKFDAPGGGFCNVSNIDATFDDAAATSVADGCAPPSPGLSGDLAPSQPLAAFNGDNLNGTWRLSVVQDGFTIGGNPPQTLDRFCIKAPLTAGNAPPPPGPETVLKSGFEAGEGEN